MQSLIPFIRCRRDRVLGAGGMDFDAKREYKVRHSHTISMFYILFSFIFRLHQIFTKHYELSNLLTDFQRSLYLRKSRISINDDNVFVGHFKTNLR